MFGFKWDENSLGSYFSILCLLNSSLLLPVTWKSQARRGLTDEI